MPQTTQDKRGIWVRNYDDTFSSFYPNGDKPNPDGTVFAHGDPVNIDGTGFGVLPTFLFAGGASGRIETHGIGADMADSDGFLLSDQRPKEVYADSARGKVWKTNILDGNPATGDNGLIVGDWGSAVPSGYKQLVYWYNRVESDSSQFQWKQYRNEVTNNYSDGGPEQVISGFVGFGGKYFMNRPDVDPGSVGASTNYTPSSDAMQPRLPSVWIGNKLFNIFSDTDTANGTTAYETLVGGVKTTIFRSTAIKHFGAGISSRMRYHVWQNYGGNYDVGDEPTFHNIYMDDLYIQVAPAGTDLISVWLCDTPLFANRTVCELQRPKTGWSDTTAKIELNRGGLPNGNYYLIVVANENTQIAAKAVTLTGTVV